MSTRSDWLHSTLTPSTIAASGPYPHGYFGTTFWDQVSSLSWFARPAVSESATCLSTGHIPGPAADGLLPSNRQELAAEPVVAAALIQDKRKGLWPAGRLGAGKAMLTLQMKWFANGGQNLVKPSKRWVTVGGRLHRRLRARRRHCAPRDPHHRRRLALHQAVLPDSPEPHRAPRLFPSARRDRRLHRLQSEQD